MSKIYIDEEWVAKEYLQRTKDKKWNKKDDEADIKFAEMILNMSDEEEESMSGEEELFSQSKKDIHTYVIHM